MSEPPHLMFRSESKGALMHASACWCRNRVGSIIHEASLPIDHAPYRYYWKRPARRGGK